MHCLGSHFDLLVGGSLFGAHAQVLAQVPGLFAQADEPESQNFLVWLLQCLGLFGMLAVLAGVAIFLGACLVVIVARRPAVIAAYLVFLPLPLLLGVTGALKGFVGAFSEVAIAGIDLKQSQIMGSLTEVLVLPLCALLTVIPSYLVIAIGLFVRTLSAGKVAATGGCKAEPVAISQRGPI